MSEKASSNPNLLLVDDDKSLLRLLTIRLEGEGYDVTAVEDGQSALRKLQNDSFDVVLSDLRMPGLDGLSLFEEIMGIRKDIPVILMTAHGTIADAVAATQRGVFGFLPKPVDHDELRTLLQKALSQSQAAQPGDWAKDIITRSPEMLNVLDQAFRIAKREVSVLISGASGTGKELLANAIHKASNRSDKPFVAINCGALPENLLESELFGHAKGAFTGAVAAHPGLFREADGGTLFLDEIGDMPMTLQVKLLRALQERQIRPVGSSKHVDIDVRIISATHKDLHKEMEESTFREDLYYRLNVVNLKLPSLKSRSEDIPLLARSLLQQSAQRHGVNVSQFSDDAMQQLVTSSWPGNVRQLVNVVEQCVALTQTPVIPLHLVEQALSATKQSWPTLTEARDAFEQQYLHKLLKMTDGNVTRAAELAGRNRTDMHKLMKKHELDAADFR
ncbi:two-component system response regulator GlrR [Alteromonas mediterranea]|uniref:Two-component system response regulator n=2 Tax=Alteromonas mediterranea TaxID=314275 RepID=S5ADX2_9ALTE|nr:MULTISPECIES: sigma 54-interacting transcriptional regulator [Alteromonas]AGP77509.1 two-component system response regulator [Alteromonas mediterranea 615]AGP93037.1 two-component system response regulator [Alteromonas mediterranea U8]MDY6882526.1 sigma 54-interacting transcriptional regulator [Pseudomonadota bacterium]AGP81281.1 two-component system response regulator [Alteromonas mediterranea MED64]AGP85033.1 two-component system response regulator [Alteromonas mediterranea U4]